MTHSVLVNSKNVYESYIMSHFILQQLVIEWKDREECCFGYVAMVSDAIPERNLMTFTKGLFLVNHTKVCHSYTRRVLFIPNFK